MHSDDSRRYQQWSNNQSHPIADALVLFIIFIKQLLLFWRYFKIHEPSSPT